MDIVIVYSLCLPLLPFIYDPFLVKMHKRLGVLMIEGDDVIFQLSNNLVSKNNSMELTRGYSIPPYPKKAAQGPVSSGPRLHCI